MTVPSILYHFRGVVDVVILYMVDEDLTVCVFKDFGDVVWCVGECERFVVYCAWGVVKRFM